MSTGHAAPRITRREGLLAFAVLTPAALLTACSSDASVPASSLTSAAGSAAPADTASLSSATAADESALIAAYDAVISSLGDAESDLRAVLGDIRAQHAAHRDALGGADDAPVPSAASGGALATQLTDLIDAERRASRARIRAAQDAEADLARTLVFVAASEASHVPVLADLRP